MSVGLFFSRRNHNCKIQTLAVFTVIISLLAGCTSSKHNSDADNRVTLSQDYHIKLKISDRANENNSTDSDLWFRMRQGFMLQQDYGINKKHIEQQRQLLTKNQKSTQRLLEKGTPYLYYIISQLEERNMPLELALLPAVESAYTPTAYSHQKAAGLWQFMPITARHFKLQQTRWYDARLDVVASTNAALNYLQYLHNMFNDWPLALAAYNAGEGTVQRAIANNRKQNLPVSYWDLTLPKETTLYVPKLLALSEVIFTPDNFKMALPPIADEPYFELVELNQQNKLSTIATSLGVDNGAIERLNAGFLQQTVVKNESPRQLLIPRDKVSQFTQMIAQGGIPEDKITLWNSYQIKQGDTLGAIAKHHNTTVNELRAMNKLAANQLLKLGATLRVPLTAPTSIKAPVKTNTKTNNTMVAKGTKKYTIKEGDSLWVISQRNNIKLEKLLQLNKLTTSSSIKPGQQLFISDR